MLRFQNNIDEDAGIPESGPSDPSGGVGIDAGASTNSGVSSPGTGFDSPSTLELVEPISLASLTVFKGEK